MRSRPGAISCTDAFTRSPRRASASASASASSSAAPHRTRRRAPLGPPRRYRRPARGSDQSVLFANEIAAVRAVLGAGLPEARVVAALSRCGGNTDRAVNALLDADGSGEPEKCRVKAERDDVAGEPAPMSPPVKVKTERPDDSPPVKAAPLLPRRVEEEKTSRGRVGDCGISLVPRPAKVRRDEEAEIIDAAPRFKKRAREDDAGEVVHFAFPSYDRFHGGIKVSVKKAAGLAQIVRFSTRRVGEIGKLSSEWTKCLVPLVNSSKV